MNAEGTGNVGVIATPKDDEFPDPADDSLASR
jgi:hypothetical protein